MTESVNQSAAIRRSSAWPALILTALSLLTASALAETLPRGFGGITVGQNWLEAREGQVVEEISQVTNRLDGYAQACGYAEARIDAGIGELLVTVHDFVVTGLDYATPLRQDASVMEVADTILKTYGQPAAASMRDVLGQVTIDRDRVNYVQLDYKAADPVRFVVSGRELWQYQISVAYQHKRWHENKTYRCARQMEKKALAAKAAEKTS